LDSYQTFSSRLKHVDTTLKADASLLDDAAAHYLMPTLMQPQVPKGAPGSGHANAAFS
jgi:hypothetical protein